jgi:uracil-DNA glycosylase
MNLLERIPQDWQQLLAPLAQDPEWIKLLDHLQAQEMSARANLGDQIAPPEDRVFRALATTRVDEVKVVILGQDPYHTPELAQGLAFSIPEAIRPGSRYFPSSLRNISKALALDGFKPLFHGNLENWAKQGVLLLNATLTVQLGHANAHADWGWQTFTDKLIEQLALRHPIAWFLWGSHAQKKATLIPKGCGHLTLLASHPSGLSVYKTSQPFLYPGDKKSCGHFKQANDWLITQQKSPISW